jgi:hypothetical protein
MRQPFGLALVLVTLAACSGGGGTGGSSGESTQGDSGGGSGDSGSGSSSGSGGSSGGDAGLVTYGQPYTDGQYNLGPVDYAESQFHNACAPSTKYDPRVQSVEGTLLAGLWNGIPNVAGYCDACIWVVTAKGKSAMLRVVTYGDTSTDSIDTSQSAYTLLDSGEYPRMMTWQFAECPDTGPILYEFQTASSQYWTSLWVRNARVPRPRSRSRAPITRPGRSSRAGRTARSRTPAASDRAASPSGRRASTEPR